jgi:hypothetical protein
MPEDRTSRGDIARWSLAGVMAVVFFLMARQLSADNTGRVITVAISVALHVASIRRCIRLGCTATSVAELFCVSLQLE